MSAAHLCRVAALRAKLAGGGLAALIVSQAENRYYLSGFTGTSGWLVIGPGHALLVTDGRYAEQARGEAPEFHVVEHPPGEHYETMAAVLRDFPPGPVGFEPHATSYASHGEMLAKLGGRQLAPAGTLVEDLRLTKDSGELALIRRAVALADRAFEHICRFVRPGVREADLALEVEFFLRREGADEKAFPTIVASGPRSALPHGVASARRIAAGEFVTLDFGCRVEGYHSDITRTVCVGEPAREQQALYDLVLEAQRAGIAAIRPGRTGRDADAAARAVIAAAGHGARFSHGLGHGVGLAVHEGPRLSPKSEDVLEAGMVVTVEPGVYVPGIGGVRLEDVVCVTAGGCEVLTRAPKRLRP